MVKEQGLDHINASRCMYNLWASDTGITKINGLAQVGLRGGTQGPPR